MTLLAVGGLFCNSLQNTYLNSSFNHFGVLCKRKLQIPLAAVANRAAAAKWHAMSGWHMHSTTLPCRHAASPSPSDWARHAILHASGPAMARPWRAMHGHVSDMYRACRCAASPIFHLQLSGGKWREWREKQGGS